MQEVIEHLVRALTRLPGIGRRTAERIALRLVRDRSLGRELIEALRETEEGIRLCARCGAMTPADEDPCRLCTNPRRESRLLCVVEEPGDIQVIERTGAFGGRYHALMGRLSPMRGDGPANLRVESLMQRLREEPVEEVMLALNTDVEGESTAAYLQEQLHARGVRVTRLAYGIPAGSGIAYSDPITLSRAIEGRRDV